MITNNTKFGVIQIGQDAIASLVRSAISESYGIMGLSSNGILEDISSVFKKNNNLKGINTEYKNGKLFFNLYVTVSYGVKIIEVIHELQKNIKYIVENQLEIEVAEINVYVQSVGDKK